MAWAGEVNGVTDPAAVNGVLVANIQSVNGVESSVVDVLEAVWSYGQAVITDGDERWSYGKSKLFDV